MLWQMPDHDPPARLALLQRRAGKAREDRNPGIAGRLCGHEFLATRVMPSLNGVTTPTRASRKIPARGLCVDPLFR